MADVVGRKYKRSKKAKDLYLLSRTTPLHVQHPGGLLRTRVEIRGGGGVLGYFLGGYVPPGTPNWHPVLKKKFPLKLIPRARNGPIFYTLF